MPSSRRLKVAGLAAFITICVIIYLTNGASSTQKSAFYTRTVAAIQAKQASRANQDTLAEERHRLERVNRIAKEHSAAVGDDGGSSPQQGGSANQKPMIPMGEYGEGKVADLKAGERSVAGRKYMKDGKVVTYKSGEGEATGADGVARVGNVDSRSSHEAAVDEKAVEAEFGDILRKGPIIIFSKSYCPFSKKAKHILLDLYSISPPPYVVELDKHDLGMPLQGLLGSLTGRHTVPNVLINGKSIGGGDDIEQLHRDDALASTIASMGGKRMTKIEKLDHEIRDSEMRFRA